MARRPEDILAGKKRPFTGPEYLESLRDGREVYIYGERVKDVTQHPAFRNAAVSVAKLYDALHDRSSKEVLTTATDTGTDGYTHRFFKAARSRENLIKQRDAIAAWARISYGWMGRSPDYHPLSSHPYGSGNLCPHCFACKCCTPRGAHRRQRAVKPCHQDARLPPLVRVGAGPTLAPSRRTGVPSDRLLAPSSSSASLLGRLARYPALPLVRCSRDIRPGAAA